MILWIVGKMLTMSTKMCSSFANVTRMLTNLKAFAKLFLSALKIRYSILKYKNANAKYQENI